MPIVKVVRGNLLKATEPYIAHQCNCVTTSSSGLANEIAVKWPWADTYKNRTEKSVPGTISINFQQDSSDNTPAVICMYSQYYPGKNVYGEHRLEWFKECLDAMYDIDPENLVAMPKNIGCGLAGGNWIDYKTVLNESKLNIVLYEL